MHDSESHIFLGFLRLIITLKTMTAITKTRIDMQDKAKNIDLALFVNMLFFSTSFLYV
jgi:hypothetical protein